VMREIVLLNDSFSRYPNEAPKAISCSTDELYF
jgi:hypothetical protein